MNILRGGYMKKVAVLLVMILCFGVGAVYSAGVVDALKVYLEKNGWVEFEGTTSDNYKTKLNVVNPTANRTVSLPNESGTLIVGGTTAAQTLNNDLTVAAASNGGNAYTRNNIVGLMKLTLAALGTGTSGAAAGKTVTLTDDTPAGEFTASDADVVCSNDAAVYRYGSNSLKMAVTTAADAGDGCHDGVTLDFTGDEFIGFWVRSSVALAAGDLVLDLTDDGGQRQANVPALVAGVWTWVNIGLPALDADKNTITDISVELSAAGATKAAAGAFDVNVDFMMKWDDTEEEETGSGIIQDGVLSVVAVATAAGSPNTTTNLAEGTDYFVKYTASNEKIVWITDQSAVSTFALLALE
jgi:hypothetical protein